MLKTSLIGAAAALCLSFAMVAPSFAETTAQEMREHPRIAKAIREIEDAIKYLEAAPHDFGGHKAKAIADSRAAVTQLREAIKYRVMKDNKKK